MPVTYFRSCLPLAAISFWLTPFGGARAEEVEKLRTENGATHQKARVKDTNRHWARIGDVTGNEGGQESSLAVHRRPRSRTLGS